MKKRRHGHVYLTMLPADQIVLIFHCGICGMPCAIGTFCMSILIREPQKKPDIIVINCRTGSRNHQRTDEEWGASR